MMKSFFKKLAFVMALAMVVSLVAPAGSAFAAEAGIALQNTDAVVTTWELEKAGDTVDFRFIGAPSDWKKTYEWTSSNETVATVDKAGLVTAVAEGTATIKITAGADASYVHTVEVTVGELENTYTVKQINHNKVTLTFLEKVDFKADDVTLSKMYDGEEVFWPIQNVKVDANTITYETYINYEDGEEYVVRVGAEDAGTSYVTTIGDVTQVKLSYGTTKDAQNNLVYPGKAYSNGEEGDDLTVYLSAKLYNRAGVEVTDYYTTDDVVFELAEDNEDIMIDNYSGEVTFYKVGIPTVITATYTYYDAEGEQHDIKSLPTPVVSEKAPAYGIKSVDAWAVVKDTVTNYNDINWNNHEIMAEDDLRNGYKVVVKFTDTNGNQYITDDSFSNLPYNLYGAEDSDYDFADKGNYVTFSSSNTNKLLVGEDGDLTTSDKTKVAVIFTLRNYDSEKEDFFVKNVSAFQVEVKAKRKVSSVALNTNNVTVITDSNEAGFTERTVEAYVYDQYNTKWYENVTLSFSSTVEGAPSIANATYTANDKATFKVDGAWFETLNKQTVAYTVKEGKNGNTTTLKVVVKNPKLDEGDIKITSYALAADSVNMVSNWNDGNDNKSTTIHYYELSNSVEVGHKDGVQLITTDAGLKIEEDDTAKGLQYVVIYDSKGRVVPASGSALISDGTALVTQNESGKYTLHVAELNEDDKLMDYAPTGTYTVKVLEVRDFSKGYAVFRTKYEKSFDVSNGNSNVELRKQEKVDVTIKLDPAYFAEDSEYTAEQRMEAAIKDVVYKAFSVNKAGSKWNYNTSNILDVDYKMNDGQNSVIIRSVTFKVPLATNRGFYEYKLTINRAVDVTLIPDAE